MFLGKFKLFAETEQKVSVVVTDWMLKKENDMTFSAAPLHCEKVLEGIPLFFFNFPCLYPFQSRSDSRVSVVRPSVRLSVRPSVSDTLSSIDFHHLSTFIIN